MIKITDKRIADGTQVNAENIEVQVSKSASKTFTVENLDGSLSETTLNVVESVETTTLKDIDAELSNLTVQRATLQTQLDDIDARILATTNTRADVDTAIKKI